METKELAFKMQTDNERIVFLLLFKLFFNQNFSEISFDLLNGLVINGGRPAADGVG